MAQGEKLTKKKESRKSPFSSRKRNSKTAKGERFIAQKKQVKGKSRQLAAKLEKVRLRRMNLL